MSFICFWFIICCVNPINLLVKCLNNLLYLADLVASLKIFIDLALTLTIIRPQCISTSDYAVPSICIGGLNYTRFVALIVAETEWVTFIEFNLLFRCRMIHLMLMNIFFIDSFLNGLQVLSTDILGKKMSHVFAPSPRTLSAVPELFFKLRDSDMTLVISTCTEFDDW